MIDDEDQIAFDQYRRDHPFMPAGTQLRRRVGRGATVEEPMGSASPLPAPMMTEDQALNQFRSDVAQGARVMKVYEDEMRRHGRDIDGRPLSNPTVTARPVSGPGGAALASPMSNPAALATPGQRANAVATHGGRLPTGARIGESSVPGAGVYESADPAKYGRYTLSQERRTAAMDAGGVMDPSPLSNPAQAARVALQSRRQPEPVPSTIPAPASAVPTAENPRSAPASASPAPAPRPMTPAAGPSTFSEYGAAGLVGSALTSSGGVIKRGAEAAAEFAPAAAEGAAEGLIGRRGVQGFRNSMSAYGDALATSSSPSLLDRQRPLPSPDAVASARGMDLPGVRSMAEGARRSRAPRHVLSAFQPQSRPSAWDSTMDAIEPGMMMFGDVLFRAADAVSSVLSRPTGGFNHPFQPPAGANVKPKPARPYQAAADRFNPFKSRFAEIMPE